MALLDDIKTALSISTDRRDSEVQTFIDAALYELGRVGVDPDVLGLNGDGDLDNALVKHAVIAYCKAHRGQDVPNVEYYEESFERIERDLMNSFHNIAAIDGGE